MSSARHIACVSHLASADEVTGAERSLLHLARAMRDDGRRVSWLSPRVGRSVDEAMALGIEARVLPWPQLYLASWRASFPGTMARAARFALAAPRLPGLASTLRGIAPDVVLVNTLVNVGAAWAARSAGLPVLWRVAEIPGDGPRRRLLAAATARWGDQVVAVSHAVADALALPTVRVVPSGVDLPSNEEVARRRRALRESLGLADDAVIVGHVGQVRPHKGQREFVSAVLGRDPDITFAILGALDRAPAFVRELRARSRLAGDRIRFAGFVAGGAAALDVVAFTSTAPDPFPLVVLEAMAAGVPVVAFAAGGVPEAIVDGESGRLVPLGDVVALGTALMELAHDAGLRRSLGEAARRRVEERYTVERTAAGYLDVLDEVAGHA